MPKAYFHDIGFNEPFSCALLNRNLPALLCATNVFGAVKWALCWAQSTQGLFIYLSRKRHDWQHLTDETCLVKATILEKYEKVKHTMAAEALNVIVRCFIGPTREIIIITAAG